MKEKKRKKDSPFLFTCFIEIVTSFNREFVIKELLLSRILLESLQSSLFLPIRRINFLRAMGVKGLALSLLTLQGRDLPFSPHV